MPWRAADKCWISGIVNCFDVANSCSICLIDMVVDPSRKAFPESRFLPRKAKALHYRYIRSLKLMQLQTQDLCLTLSTDDRGPERMN